VVVLQPTLVKLQRLARSQGAKDGYITPKAYLSPSWGEVFFVCKFKKIYTMQVLYGAGAIDLARFFARYSHRKRRNPSIPAASAPG